MRETNLFVYCTYIRNQSEHHKVTLEQEFPGTLEKG
jgi:hypothetical protein